MTGHFTSYKTRPNHELATRRRGCLDAVEHPARLKRGLERQAQSAAASAFGSSRSMSF
jgi:hypothetical protein